MPAVGGLWSLVKLRKPLTRDKMVDMITRYVSV